MPVYNTYIANVSSIIYKTILEISNIVHGNLRAIKWIKVICELKSKKENHK